MFSRSATVAPCARPSRRHRTRSGAALLLLLVLVTMLVNPQGAWAHAQLLGSSPVSGATLPSQPAEVIFKFNQAVGGTLGAVRVYDGQGREVDDLDVSHPGGNERWMGVGLQTRLPDGTYTATYRVISADTHIVYGGLVFSIGRAGPAPRFTVTGLIDRQRTGSVTAVAFGIVRALDYLTLALFVGGLLFALHCWNPSLGKLAADEERWHEASGAFARRSAKLLAGTIVLGVLVSLLGIMLQGASAAGVSLWHSLKGAVVRDTLESRFGTVWGLRALDWLALGGVLLAARARRSPPIRSLATELGGQASPRLTTAAPRPLVGVLAAGCAYLVATPALAGHASIESPTGVFLPSDILHVLAGSVWVGGLACLLIALPAATRRLEGPERSRLLLETLRRFSPLALAAVIAIAATGIVQAYIDVRSLNGLLHTTYGLLVLAKTALLLALISLGWVNRSRVIPALGRIAGAGAQPGATGVLARRTMRSELALMLSVFGLTAALISYAPPIDAASGPFSAGARIGVAELELSVEPARVGPNAIHMYLFDARTGAQFTATKELTVSARLPAKGIGPLALRPTLAGPGHYVLNSAVLSPGGSWDIEITDRTSEFEESSRTIKVPIR
jgi:copper transport protein